MGHDLLLVLRCPPGCEQYDEERCIFNIGRAYNYGWDDDKGDMDDIVMKAKVRMAYAPGSIEELEEMEMLVDDLVRKVYEAGKRSVIEELRDVHGFEVRDRY